MEAERKQDHFPSTERTRILGLIAEGDSGRREIHRIVMSPAYLKALRAYFLGSSFRGLGDPDEMVDGFFASRLSDASYFNKWEAEWRRSGMPLRRWLMNGFHFYLKETVRDEEKARGLEDLPADAPIADQGPSPEQAFHRALLLERVRNVLQRVKVRCRNGLSEEHWRVFHSWWIEESGSWADIGERFSVSTERAKRMARTVLGYFDAEFRMELRRDGVPESRVNLEIQDLLREVGS